MKEATDPYCFHTQEQLMIHSTVMNAGRTGLIHLRMGKLS